MLQLCTADTRMTHQGHFRRAVASLLRLLGCDGGVLLPKRRTPATRTPPRSSRACSRSTSCAVRGRSPILTEAHGPAVCRPSSGARVCSREKSAGDSNIFRCPAQAACISAFVRYLCPTESTDPPSVVHRPVRGFVPEKKVWSRIETISHFPKNRSKPRLSRAREGSLRAYRSRKLLSEPSSGDPMLETQTLSALLSDRIGRIVSSVGHPGRSRRIHRLSSFVDRPRAILRPAILRPAILRPAILRPAILRPAIFRPAALRRL
jgi:hypothetical protein